MKPQKPFNATDLNEEDDFDDLDDIDKEEIEDNDAFTELDPPKSRTAEERAREEKGKMASLIRQMQSDVVSLRVHDIIINGNNKTKDYIIKAEVEALKNVSTIQDLLRVSSAVNMRLQALEVFDSVAIRLDSGSSELPDTTNVIIEVVETANPLSGRLELILKQREQQADIDPIVMTEAMMHQPVPLLGKELFARNKFVVWPRWIPADSRQQAAGSRHQFLSPN